VNIVDILELVGKSEDAGDVGISLKLLRPCAARRARVMPGLLADVLRWGNREHPSMVYLRNTAVRAWASRSKHAMFRTWALAREKESRNQALVLIRNTFGSVAA